MAASPHGRWPSPITPAAACAPTTHLAELRGDGEAFYWLQRNPGDTVRRIMRHTRGVTSPVTGDDVDVRTALGGFGGGDFGVADGWVVYVDAADQGVWCVDPESRTRRLTTPTDGVRFAAFAVHPGRSSVVALREDVRDRSCEPVLAIVRLSLTGDEGSGEVLVQGAERRKGRSESLDEPDHLLDPALSPDGTKLAWLQWRYPGSAVEGCELVVADVDAEWSLKQQRLVAGGTAVSVEQPTWLTNSTLAYLTDDTGFSEFVVHNPRVGVARDITTDRHEYGHPRWTPGTSSYATGDGRVVFTGCGDGSFRRLRRVDLDAGHATSYPSPCIWVQRVAVAGGRVAVAGTRAQGSPAIVVSPPFAGDDPDEFAEWQVLAQTTDWRETHPFMSWPEPMRWETPLGHVVHGVLHWPVNPSVRSKKKARPPLIVVARGGPAGSAVPGMSLERSFWTSRGFTVLEANPAGATGAGREHRQRITGHWAHEDALDIAAGAATLAERGLVDPSRLAIRGAGAAALQVLNAMSTGVFAAASLRSAVLRWDTLRARTPALESRYYARVAHPDTLRIRDILGNVKGSVGFVHGSRDRVEPLDVIKAATQQLNERGHTARVVALDDTHALPDSRAAALDAELTYLQDALNITGDGPPVRE